MFSESLIGFGADLASKKDDLGDKVKEKAEELRIYAELQGLTISKFASLSMQYCKNNNINLQQEPEEENSEK